MLRSRLFALPAAGLMAISLVSCGTVQVPAGADAADPTCADIVLGAPPEVLGMERSETSSQGTAAWGSGEETIVMRCGVTPPGPTTDLCTTLADANGVEIDWIVQELEGDGFLYTTYGREPAIDVSVPQAAAPDQPSGAALDLSQVISLNIEATDRCIGPGDAQ
ncbi:MAG: DUF3515 domain-containing protein [Brachybacterium sp.]|uniref:DUF3515 domain-containing protein n=1 Tax=Brachybacterium sp. TaxID=1891286 RepID=UPI0026516E68|nr:DUF3515 domain-containing protein [Brachybacterium sp.]MDN6302902.1 DUF3515 domain-containing protein [Brachybacterium sp.]MDN6328236.1 DUF3515 domain-containing protein [Brachybacterium sp.]MDN6398926.1 DUF3515 domain-containing protein [Brachybacterium sp.]